MLTVSPICGVFLVCIFSKGEWRLHQTQSLPKLSKRPTGLQTLEDEQPMRCVDQTSRYAYIIDSGSMCAAFSQLHGVVDANGYVL